MDIPNTLKSAIESRAAGLKHEKLQADAQQMSLAYRLNKGQGQRLLSLESEAVAYAMTRMPATYGAVFSALGYAVACNKLSIKTVLDIGAGTGAASWAAAGQLDIEKITCVEREDAMIQVGKDLMAHGSRPLSEAIWEKRDIVSSIVNSRADLVISSYLLNELSSAQCQAAFELLWACSDKMLLIVEPGTPAGYRLIIRARDYLLGKGAHLLAPCPHEQKCPMTGNDWCHFSCRIARSKMHRLLKSADAPYEDEKYAYIAFSKTECRQAAGRIIRHPHLDKGRVGLDICAADGISRRSYTRKSGGAYAIAKKSNCGDSIDV